MNEVVMEGEEDVFASLREAGVDVTGLQAEVFRGAKRTQDLFAVGADTLRVPSYGPSDRLKLAVKINDEYGSVKDVSGERAERTLREQKRKMIGGSTTSLLAIEGPKKSSQSRVSEASGSGVAPGPAAYPEEASGSASLEEMIEDLPATHKEMGALQKYKPVDALQMVRRKGHQEKPQWHAPWDVYRVISGHLGHVHCCAVDVSNEWFATGSKDRTIKLWDLASGKLKITLTGHISAVRGLAISTRSPYMFSAGEDKLVKCWDLEQNKVIRQYHGHLSGCYTCELHPGLDILVTGGRDSVARVWDIRTKNQIFVLSGHKNTVHRVGCQVVDPQIITCSADSTVRCWDLAAGKASSILTNHKKGVRSLTIHPREYTFATGSADNIKKWKCPRGEFMHNMSGHNTIVHALAVNEDGVMFSGGDNGTFKFWDWKTGYNYQSDRAVVQPGSLESEAGIYDAKFDMTGTRLITCEADKSIKMWRENEEATPDSHPVRWRPSMNKGKF